MTLSGDVNSGFNVIFNHMFEGKHYTRVAWFSILKLGVWHFVKTRCQTSVEHVGPSQLGGFKILICNKSWVSQSILRLSILCSTMSAQICANDWTLQLKGQLVVGFSIRAQSMEFTLKDVSTPLCVRCSGTQTMKYSTCGRCINWLDYSLTS